MGEPRHRAGTDVMAGVWDIAMIARRSHQCRGTPRPAMTQDRINPSPPHSIAIGIACGVGAAVFWAAGFVAARQGIDIGVTPADITFHRCFWAGVVLLPLALRDGIGALNGIGSGRALPLTLFSSALRSLV